MAEQGNKLTVDEVATILKRRLDGLSIRDAADQTGHHYNTVLRYAPDAVVKAVRRFLFGDSARAD
jgi:DNA-directed RNA polymerase specialized sigma24 family protein